MLAVGLSACSTQHIKGIGKTDIDAVIDTHIKQLHRYLADLTILLYKHNPAELAKTAGMSVELRLVQIIDHPTDVVYTELHNAQQVDAIKLAFLPDFQGDRVFALMLGISSMLRFAYDDKTESFIFDQLDPQKIYSSARNLEVALNTLRRLPKGVRLNTGGRGDYALFDAMNRMIGLQDTVANLSESASKRIIRKVVRNAIFIPIGI